MKSKMRIFWKKYTFYNEKNISLYFSNDHIDRWRQDAAASAALVVEDSGPSEDGLSPSFYIGKLNALKILTGKFQLVVVIVFIEWKRWNITLGKGVHLTYFIWYKKTWDENMVPAPC